MAKTIISLNKKATVTSSQNNIIKGLSSSEKIPEPKMSSPIQQTFQQKVDKDKAVKDSLNNEKSDKDSSGILVAKSAVATLDKKNVKSRKYAEAERMWRQDDKIKHLAKKFDASTKSFLSGNVLSEQEFNPKIKKSIFQSKFKRQKKSPARFVEPKTNSTNKKKSNLLPWLIVIGVACAVVYGLIFFKVGIFAKNNIGSSSSSAVKVVEYKNIDGFSEVVDDRIINSYLERSGLVAITKTGSEVKCQSLPYGYEKIGQVVYLYLKAACAEYNSKENPKLIQSTKVTKNILVYLKNNLPVATNVEGEDASGKSVFPSYVDTSKSINLDRRLEDYAAN